jgi:hypothetical protein
MSRLSYDQRFAIDYCKTITRDEYNANCIGTGEFKCNRFQLGNIHRGSAVHIAEHNYVYRHAAGMTKTRVYGIIFIRHNRSNGVLLIFRKPIGANTYNNFPQYILGYAADVNINMLTTTLREYTAYRAHIQRQAYMSIMSFNVFSNKCNNQPLSSANIPEYVDIICTQEDPPRGQFSGFIGFRKLDKCGGGYSQVGVYYRDTIDDDKRPRIVDCIETSSQLPGTDSRYAIIFTYMGYTIANLHLEGGRFVDQKMSDDPPKYRTYKEQLLQVITTYRKSPDIILGDFNSVYADDYATNNAMAKQRQYLDRLGVHQDDILLWNKRPYDILSELGYVYSKPHNSENNFTNYRGESIVDAIWIKANIRISNSAIITVSALPDNQRFDERNCDISDHKPVVTTLFL